jgi:hypothetical protein
MLRINFSWSLLPILVACASSPAKPVASASDADAVDAKAKDDGASDMAAHPDEPAPEKSDKASDKASTSDSKSDQAEAKSAKADTDDDKPPVDDSRTTASIANVIKENRKAFKKCYEDVRKDQPDLKGNVMLKIVLDGAGKVKKAYVDDDSSIRNPKIVDCMIKLAQSLTYPKSSKGLDKDFEYDFGFNNSTK